MKIKNIPLCLAFSSTLINASQLNLFDLLSESDEESSTASEAQTFKKGLSLPLHLVYPMETSTSFIDDGTNSLLETEGCSYVKASSN
jgi:hypothetical protein